LSLALQTAGSPMQRGPRVNATFQSVTESGDFDDAAWLVVDACIRGPMPPNTIIAHFGNASCDSLEIRRSRRKCRGFQTEAPPASAPTYADQAARLARLAEV
jgi:hypothetical protein